MFTYQSRFLRRGDVWLYNQPNGKRVDWIFYREPSGAFVVFTGLFRDKQRVQLLMNVSPPRTALVPAARAKTNRASCFLIWKALLRLKEQGVRYFDFGGWYPGTEDIQLLGANAFKKGLGGQVVREYECEQIVTLK